MTYYDRLTRYGWHMFYHAPRVDYFRKGEWTVCVFWDANYDPIFERNGHRMTGMPEWMWS